MNHATARGKAIVIGGSMAGLFAGVCLRRHGWDVQIYERSDTELANRGAGIATHHELYDALRSADVELHDEMGVASDGRIMFDHHGTEIGRYDMPQLMTSWGLIYRFLRRQFPAQYYHNAHTLTDIRQQTDEVTAYFSNGTHTTGHWLIGADGARSAVRDLVAPQSVLNYCGYFGWRGLIDENLIDSEVLAEFSNRMAFGMAPGGHWLGYLVAGANDAVVPGQRWYNWGWYRTANDAALEEHMTDESGRYHKNGIPHDLIRPELVARMHDDARHYLAPQIRSVIEATRQPFLQGMYDVASDNMKHDRVFLIGDAAFTARPHVGLGVSKAADDASKLAIALSDTDQIRALGQWESERLAFGHAVVQWGRDLGSYIGPPPSDEAAAAKAKHYQQPEVLMSVTAATDPYPMLGLPSTAGPDSRI